MNLVYHILKEHKSTPDYDEIEISMGLFRALVAGDRRWARLRERVAAMGDPFDPAGTVDRYKRNLLEDIEDIERRIPITTTEK